MLGFVLAALTVTIFCVIAAWNMATNRARSEWAWMLAAALLGPLPLPVLFALPPRNPERA